MLCLLMPHYEAPDRQVPELRDHPEIGAVLLRHGRRALGMEDPDSVAREWVEAGFTDAGDVDAWLTAGAVWPDSAAALRDAGVTPAQASRITTEGSTLSPLSIGYRFANGELSLARAVELATSDPSATGSDQLEG